MRKLARSKVLGAVIGLIGVSMALVAHPQSALADPHPGQSVQVAVIGGLTNTNGGVFPTTTSGPGTSGSLTAFTFTALAPGAVSSASLAPFDSALLNVGGTSGMSCNMANLPPGGKSALVSWVASGKKLVIYDSECASGNYGWLPFPFTTNNPGAAGASGTMNIVENNTIASNVSSNIHFINEVSLETGSDAVGDANVFTTFDPNWCVGVTATNINGVNGPVLSYARYGSGSTFGLFIYNGLDQDAMGTTSAPNSAGGGAGNLAKLWMQELQTPANGSTLPCGVSAVGITLNPPSATNPVGTTHTVTSHVTNNLGAPQPGTVVAFTVLSGPNAGATGTCTVNASCATDANGDVSFTYTGSGGAGTDSIRACFTAAAGAAPVCSVTVTKTWIAPRLSVDDVTVTEGDVGTTNANFTVSLSPASTQPVTVAVNTADDTAVAPGDYGTTGTTVTFAPGETSKPFSVPVNGDVIDESNEQFFVNLSAPTNASISDGQGIGTIIDDDTSVLSVDDVTVTEGNVGTVNAGFTVSLSNPSASPVSVDVATADNTAGSPGDYTGPTTTVTFAPGETSKPYDVTVNGDLIDEADETYFVNLSNAVGAGVLDGQGIGTIVDDDTAQLYVDDVTVTEGDVGTTAATFTVSLTNPSASTVTVDVSTANGTAVSPGDYTGPTTTVTFAPGETSKTYTATVNGDLVDENNETYTVDLANPTNATILDAQGIGTIIDDDTALLSVNDVTVTEGNAGPVPATFTVSLSTPSDRTVSVVVSTANGTAVSPGDYTGPTTTVTFAPGETSKTYTVTVNGDLIDELNETYTVNLSGAVNAGIADGVGAGTIIDDDDAVLSINNVTVLEGNTGTVPATFTVTLSTPSDRTVTVRLDTADASATAGPDYVGQSNVTVTFAPGETSKPFTVQVNGDTVDEVDEVFLVNLSNPVNAGILDNQGSGTILDDDRNGAFSCRASVVRLGSIEPAVANAPDAPCKDETRRVVNFSVLAPVVKGGIANAITDQTPDNLTAPVMDGDSSKAHADIANITIVAGVNVINAQAVGSDAAVVCKAGVPTFSSSSRIASLTVNSRVITVVDGPMTVPLIGGMVLYINRTITTPTSITRQAIALTGLPLGLGDLIVAEAKANLSGNPCTSRAPAVTPSIVSAKG